MRLNLEIREGSDSEKGSTLLINSSVYWEGVLLTLYCVNCSYCKTELLYVVDRGLGPSVTYSVWSLV